MKKGKKIGVNQLLEFIPEALVANLSINTNVDHYAKVLHGKKMFYLTCCAFRKKVKKVAH